MMQLHSIPAPHKAEINHEWFAALRASMIEDKKTFDKPQNRGMRQSFVDMYSDQGHFLYELLQNADDAQATEVEIDLREDGLLFVHNGTVRFTLSNPDTVEEDQKAGLLGHINAIVYTAFSSKQNAGSNTEQKIGKFGLGFKAVYNYTNTPHIYDAPYCFKIDKDFIPELLDDRSRMQEGKTVFYLPFDKDRGELEPAFDVIKEEIHNMSRVVPQLFLNHITHIFWKYSDDATGLIAKECEKSYDCCDDGIIANKYLLDAGDKKEHVIMLSKKYDFEGQGKDTIKLVYWLNDDGSINTTKRQQGLYSFFPLKQDFNTCYAAHAPFILTSNRERFSANIINSRLVEAIGDLSANALLILKKIGLTQGRRLVDKNVFHLIDNNESRPKRYSWEDPQRTLDEFCTTVLKKEAVFTNRQGDYVTADEVVWGDDDMKQLFTPTQMSALWARHVDFADLPKWDKYLSLAGITTFSYKLLAEKFSSTFLSAQSEDWLNTFYQFLLDKKLCDNGKAPLAEAPCIKVKSGGFVKLWKDRNRNELYFDDGSNIAPDKLIDDNLYATCEPFRQLVDKAGIEKPNEVQVLLNRTERMDYDGDPQKIKDLLVDILVFIKNNSAGKSQELVKGLKERSLKVACRHTSQSDAANVEFIGYQDVFQDDDLIKAYFNLAGLERAFACWDFYADTCAQKDIVEEDFGEFLSHMSVRTRPLWKSETICVPLEKKDDYLKLFGIEPNYDTIWEWKDLQYTHTLLEGLQEVLGKLSLSENANNDHLSHVIWEWLCYDCRDAKQKDVPFPIPDELKYLPTRRSRKSYKSQEKDLTLPWLKSTAWLNIGNVWKCVDDGLTQDDLKANNYLMDENLLVALGIRESSSQVMEREKAGLSKEGQEVYELGETIREKGIRSNEEAAEIIELGLQAKRKKEEEVAEQARRDQEAQERARFKPTSPYVSPTDIPMEPARRLTSIDFSPSESSQQRGGELHRKTYSYRNTDITKGFDDANLRFEEMEKMAIYKEQAETCPRYSYRWLKACMALEAMAHGRNDEEATTKRTVKIEFAKASCRAGRDELIVLHDSPQYIPSFIEDVEDIPVSFTLVDGNKRELTFDAASVEDERLVLKGSGKAKEFIADVSSGEVRIDHARISMEKPVEIIGKWKDLVYKLELDNDTSLKNALRPDLQFIFGPPGTGKTTQIASFIKEQMAREQGCKILVLAPTNKACDVLTEKILDVVPEDNYWLWRFVSTMSSRLEEGGFVHSRAEDIQNMENVCLVSTMARYAFDGFQYGKFLLRTLDWDYVIVDEASMVPLYQMVAPIFNTHSKKIIVAGDPFQIEPIVKIEEWKGENIYSMINLHDFATYTTEPRQYEVQRLLTQYRSIPSVGNVYSCFSYGGLLVHHRTEESRRVLNLGMDAQSLNIISFPVSSQSIFETKRLAGSNIQIYSAIFAVELIRYIAAALHEHGQSEPVSIGVTGPYRAEIQAISKMYGECEPVYSDVEVVFGTSHGFQGDECDVVVVVANPPASGMVRAADKTFLNNRNILNVAISRARDYLFVLMPDRNYQHFDQMTAIKNLGKIMTDAQCRIFTSTELEQLMLGNDQFIKANTFVTSHQTTNVYTRTNARYEVRIDENNIDITIH